MFQPHTDGAQVSGVGDYSTVRGILNKVHRAREGCSNICQDHTEKYTFGIVSTCLDSDTTTIIVVKN